MRARHNLQRRDDWSREILNTESDSLDQVWRYRGDPIRRWTKQRLEMESYCEERGPGDCFALIDIDVTSLFKYTEELRWRVVKIHEVESTNSI